MRVTYTGRHDAVSIPFLDIEEVRRGETIAVPDDIGAALLRQAKNWREAAAPAPSKPAKANP